MPGGGSLPIPVPALDGADLGTNTHPLPTAGSGITPVFELDRVSYRYQGRFPALIDVSLSIQPGQKVAILGANGSGKSTLLKMLAGLYFSASGSIRAFGQELSEARLADDATNWAFRRRVGFVFQDPDVQLFSATVWDDVAFGPLQLGLPRSELAERVRRTLDRLGIEHLAERVPYGLSGGEKKKVALATALVMEPEVLLLDEPTAALDPRSERALVELIVDWNASGHTVITATHDLDLVAELADRAIVFGEGKTLVRDGPPGEILGDHEFLAAHNLAHSHAHRHATAGEVAVHAHPHLHHELPGHTSPAS